MSGSNDDLAAVLDRGRPGDEADALLAALLAGGVFVPVSEGGKVQFIGDRDSGPMLPGYTSEACRQQWQPQAAGSVHCDAARLIDIHQATGVEKLALFATREWARLPLALVSHALIQQDPGGRSVMLTWSTHPVAVALRDAFAARILRHPQVRCVWIAHARWADTGQEHLMVQIAVDEGAQPVADALMKAVMAEDLADFSHDQHIAMMALTPGQGDYAADLDRKGLDTVRADHTANRVHVISRQFDQPR
ncbi:hypothetical protein GCM10010168_28110 [Actinoplanes ianthinogenes]|uniref:Uncharacterized protein n=1 Tax=Actinoplanes ianthinogenes TaxID=122358 RepID=A0ABM7LL16_9ACTN|nr:SseB family protein [Actinoplanes ianthinogenes]BCJ39952.1 hypothetical protein Aiant_06090 [Actinoplanes ianthinogenes]GGR09245.1 hypothetical protein GCM10010168_28110 [Actinoplanes ianthinogenes]